MQTTFRTIDRFFDGAQSLRKHFDERFGDPRSTSANRFIWDYWNVPGQYTALRTPAYLFFPKKIYDDFHQQLVWWGRRTLGCHDVSPPWLSCYVEGCKQEIHGDLPHGPWAFVYSLTPWKKRKFTGGQTFLMRDEILDYWRGESPSRGLEHEEVFLEIEPQFNRLTVFDPRIPHGVREVRGVNDVRDGRLVVHGWFMNPRPFIEGPLSARRLQGAIDDLSGELNRLFAEGLEIHGLLSIRLNVDASGAVSKVETLASTLRNPSGDERIEPALARHLAKFLKNTSFGKQRGPSRATLPLIFERS